MTSKPAKPALSSQAPGENVTYIRQMLGELRTVADHEGADMLRYFIEMAYVEAGDIIGGFRPLSIRKDGNPAAGMPLKPSGKVKL